MRTIGNTVQIALFAIAVTLFVVPTAVARVGAGDGKMAKKTAGAADASSESPAPAIEEQLKRQAETLERLETMLVRQQEEIERLRGELDAVRAAARPAVETAPGATPAASDVAAATAGAATPAAPTTLAPGAAASGAAASAPDAVATDAAAQPAQNDALAKTVEKLDKMWGGLRLSGDIRFRYEGFANQGFDGAADVDPRNRLRLRLRAQLSGRIDDHFDWGIRVASGDFNDPVSTNQTLTDYFNRHPMSIDRLFLHYAATTGPASFDVYAGKFDYTWKRTSASFDNDLQPEGLAERLAFKTGDRTPLRGITFSTWQLPYRERSVGADAYIYGGQVLTDWKWSDTWSSQLSGAFHDFEQVDVIPPVTNVPTTVVNAGFDYGTTNVVVVNPFTGLPEYRSEYRVIDTIADLRYTGFGPRFPLVLLVNWLHNTSAFNNQRDGGLATVQIGRAREEGDVYFEYAFLKNEREVFPSVFVESDVIQTNGVNHWVAGSYMIRRNVEFAVKYFLERRLQTTSPVNRWLNRYQVDMSYRF
jgi:hypothetical protein